MKPSALRIVVVGLDVVMFIVRPFVALMPCGYRGLVSTTLRKGAANVLDLRQVTPPSVPAFTNLADRRPHLAYDDATCQRTQHPKEL